MLNISDQVCVYIYICVCVFTCQLYHGLWLHSHRKDGANSTCLQPTKRNRRSHKDAIWKQSKSLFHRWWHRLLQHCRRCTAKRHISPIHIYQLSRLCWEHLLIKIKENSLKLTYERSRRYPAQTITDANYAGDIVLLANVPAQAETLLHSLEWAAAGIGLLVNAHKTEYMCSNQTGDISTLNSSSLKLVAKFTYLGSSVSLAKTDINMWLAKAWTAINRLSYGSQTWLIKWKFFQAVIMLILLYRCTTWTLTKHMEKKLMATTQECSEQYWARPGGSTPQSSSCTATYHQSWKIIQIRQTRHAGHWWRSKDELISDVLLWTPSHGRAKAGQPARTYIQQLCADVGYSLEDLPEEMDDREGWWERVRDIRADGVTWSYI